MLRNNQWNERTGEMRLIMIKQNKMMIVRKIQKKRIQMKILKTRMILKKKIQMIVIIKESKTSRDSKRNYNNNKNSLVAERKIYREHRYNNNQAIKQNSKRNSHLYRNHYHLK
jgi:hypothetical protein